MKVKVGNPIYGGFFAIDEAAPLSFVLPGELVELRQSPDSKPPLVLESSPHRVAAGCVHFGECGGCQYQHGDAAYQVELKRQILGDTLVAAGLSFMPEIQVHAAAAWRYRNRIRVRLDTGTGGSGAGTQAGYSRRGSNEFLPIRMCPIAAPLLWRAVTALLEISSERSRSGPWLEAVSEVELFADAEETRLQAQFFLRDARPAKAEPAAFAEVCERLKQLVPELCGAGAELAPELQRRVRRAWAGAAWGAQGLSYEAAGRSYWVSRGAFFQVNRWLVDRLVALVSDHAGEGGLTWDLFAGVGLFTRALAENFERVIAVEAGEMAAADLLRASQGGKTGPAYTAVRAAVQDFLGGQQMQRERPEAVVLDPPRAGLGAEASAMLARIGAARIVYVSCDPVTLARDLRALTRSGYTVETIDLVDLFPQTYHLETVVKLRRG